MKDTSKAKWPDGMTALRIHNSYRISGENEWVATVNSIERNEELEARARQVRHLPEMVALLKEIAEQSLFFENENGEYEVTEYHHEAQATLRSIGEVE